MERLMNGNIFKTIIDIGSSVTIFTIDQIKEKIRRKELQVRRMIPGEKNVDFNGKPLAGNIEVYIVLSVKW